MSFMNKDLPMTRARLFVLIGAFELDIRSIIQKYVVDEIGEEACLGGFFESCLSKRLKDPTARETPLVNFLELRESYDILNVHRKELPADLAREVRELTPNLDHLVGIRNRVMHARPLAAGDGDAAVSLLSSYVTRFWTELRRTLAHLNADPTWEPLMDSVVDQSATLHNLPLPDYDDTGLVGRTKEIEELVALLKRGREPVVTITGEGGIGKTALAIEVAYNLVDDPSFPFEAVLWTSLKFEKLTAFGVREISGAARDVVGAVRPIGQAMEKEFTGSVGELSALLEGFKVLLILDNMETISGQEFRMLYNSLPDSVTYLITSRIGVGEYERRYALGALSDKDSIQLFNQFVRTRRIESLSRLSGNTRIHVVKELRFSPLAIKWFALAVEAGNDPLSLIRHQDELLEFCVRSVYNDLSKPARNVLIALAVLSRPLTTDELVLLLEVPTDEVSVGVQELMRGSLVRRENVGSTDDLLSQITLTDTATQFLSRRIQPDEFMKRHLETRDREFREVQERRANDIASRSLAPVVVRHRSAADIPTCTILRQALLAARKGGDPSVAYEKIDLARRMNPDFWEVDRVEGFIRDAYNDLTAATASYARAYSNAVDEDRAVVAHFFAGHLARKVRDTKRAIEFAREAHHVLGTPDTGVALANYLIWSNEFFEGISLLQGVIPKSSGKVRVIAISSLAEGWKRAAINSGEADRNFLRQSELAWKGFEIALTAIEAGIVDERLRGTAAECAVLAMRALTVCLKSGIKVPDIAENLTQLGSKLVRLTGTRSWPILVTEISRLSSERTAPSAARKVREIVNGLSEESEGVSERPTVSKTLMGEIVSVRDRYGFIRHPRYPENIFFHSGDLVSEYKFSDLRSGSIVQFEVESSGRGPRGIRVNVVPL